MVYPLQIIKLRIKENSAGFTYFGFLFLVMLIGLGLAGASLILRVQDQRQKEQELLFVGQQYIDAIGSYYNSASGISKKYPQRIADLLQDTRFLTVKRHLRKPWNDPLTNKEKWGIVYTNLGGIAGFYSLTQGRPLKQTGFLGELNDKFTGKSSYREWRFVYLPSTGKVEAKDLDIDENSSPDQFADSDVDSESQEFVIGIDR